MVTDDIHIFTEAPGGEPGDGAEKLRRDAQESPSERMLLFSFFLLLASSSVKGRGGRQEGRGDGALFENLCLHTVHPRKQLSLHLRTQRMRESICSALLLVCRLLARSYKRPSNEVHLLFSALPKQFRFDSSKGQELRTEKSARDDLQLGSDFSSQLLVIRGARGDEPRKRPIAKEVRGKEASSAVYTNHTHVWLFSPCTF